MIDATNAPRSQPALTQFWIDEFEKDLVRLRANPNLDLSPRLVQAQIEATESIIATLREDLARYTEEAKQRDGL